MDLLFISAERDMFTFATSYLKFMRKKNQDFFLCVVAEPYNILLFFTPIIAVNFFSVIKFKKKNLI